MQNRSPKNLLKGRKADSSPHVRVRNIKWVPTAKETVEKKHAKSKQDRQ